MKRSPAPKHLITRRSLVAGLPLFVAGCGIAPDGDWLPDMQGFGRYGAINDNGHLVPAIDLTTIDGSLLRRQVAWRGRERPGSIVVVIPERRLYLVQGEGRAMRYAVGVGRAEALNFRGTAVIGRKEKWPRWTPTATMIAAIPRYRAYANGMDGGIDNPLGARALYLYRDGRDTYFRIHGTIEPETIGSAVSSGCIRMFNQDVIDLFNRVPIGTHVTVLQS
jgi:lipoprotein-anchoring transpeptidase ErfK/SrfK